MVSLTELRLRAVRSRIAEVAAAGAVPAALGSIRLRPHQQLAAARVTRMIARHGGCLLADDVGRGKTYVALAVASQWRRPLVVVPASLRGTWQRAMERARVSCTMVTHEALSRGSLPSCRPDGVIVDESHHFRSPDARRHAALATITAYAPVLLLSATPLQNGARDLAAQLAFFLGSSAFARSDAALTRFVVRSGESGDAALPVTAPPAWLPIDDDDGGVLRAILALPPPARSLDAGDAGVLRTIGLVRAWASSRATLAAALRRRLRAVTALEQCAASGLTPTRRELRAWHGVGGDVQLALAPLLVSHTDDGDARALLAAVNGERDALDRLRDRLRDSPDPDPTRVAQLRRLRARHPDARILAFSEFAATVRAYFALLRADAGVGMLTANDARIASGRLPRDALLDRFAPMAQGANDPAPHERVTLLLSTDVLSEGMNLQDASLVVHLDLPWNPARLAQRLGRVRRPGGAAVVQSYLMAPPATTELLLRVEARLRAKLTRAERSIGRTFDVMPTLAQSPGAVAVSHDPSAASRASIGASAEVIGAIAGRVAAWQRVPSRRLARSARAPLVAAVACHEQGWLAAIDDGGMIARVASSPVSSNTAVARALELASGSAMPCTTAARECALAEATDWLAREALALDCGVRADSSPLDAALERRIARVLARSSRHERPPLLRLAARLRKALGTTRPLGAERALERLLTIHGTTTPDDTAWLEHSIAVAERTPTHRVQSAPRRLVALIVFGG